MSNLKIVIYSLDLFVHLRDSISDGYDYTKDMVDTLLLIAENDDLKKKKKKD